MKILFRFALICFPGGIRADVSHGTRDYAFYISASIIVQMMTAVIPSLDALKKGQAGQRQINKYTPINPLP